MIDILKSDIIIGQDLSTVSLFTVERSWFDKYGLVKLSYFYGISAFFRFCENR